MAMGTSGREVENKGIVNLNGQAINTRDRLLLEQTMAPNLIRHCQATPEVQVRCLDDFWNFLQSDWATFPDAKIVPQQLVAEGDRVAVFARYEGTQLGPMGPFPPSGKRLSLDFAAFSRIEGGKIAEMWVTWDNMAALSQLGHFPPAEPPAG
jgi:predicted ester cyclase